MGRYSNIVLMMFGYIFFFNKKMTCSLSVSAFITKASNFIMKFTVFCFPCLKDLIFHLTSAAFILLVSKILLLVRNNCIPLHQSLNFVLSPSNYPRFRTILFGITVCMLLFVIASAGAADISLFDHLFILLEASFVIFKDPNLSNSVSISFVLYKLVLFFLWSIPHVFCSLSGGNFT